MIVACRHVCCRFFLVQQKSRMLADVKDTFVAVFRRGLQLFVTLFNLLFMALTLTSSVPTRYSSSLLMPSILLAIVTNFL